MPDDDVYSIKVLLQMLNKKEVVTLHTKKVLSWL